MRNLKPLSSKWVLVAGTALVTTAKHPRFLAMLGMTGYRTSYATLSLRGNDEKCQRCLALELITERLPASQQLDVRLATPEGHHGSRLAKSEQVVSTQFTPEDGNRPELDGHALRNDLVGKSRPRPKLGNRRADIRVSALQLQRSHPIAVVADEDEIAPSLRLPNLQVRAIHVNENVRLRRAPQIYRTSLLLTPCGKTSMWDVRFNTANESDIQPWSPLCGSILPRSHCRFHCDVIETGSKASKVLVERDLFHLRTRPAFLRPEQPHSQQVGVEREVRAAQPLPSRLRKLP